MASVQFRLSTVRVATLIERVLLSVIMVTVAGQCDMKCNKNIVL